jgi:hypothetical protein
MKVECNTVMERERVTVSRRILPTEIALGSVAHSLLIPFPSS